MLGQKQTHRRDELVLTSLERRVPARNFYRHLEAKLDLSFVREWVASKYAAGGRPSIDPVVFFKLQLILFFEGLRSERKLMEAVDLNVAHRWYLGYGFDEPVPDHSSLTRIRTRLGLPIFQRFFEKVVELCQDAGLVSGKELFFDTTKVAANADFDSLVPRFYQRAQDHIDQLFAAGEAGTDTMPEQTEARHEATVPPEDGSPPVADATATTAGADELPVDAAVTAVVPLPFTGSAEAEQRLTTTNQTTWRVLDELRLDPERPASRGYQRKADLRVSTTDPDATTIQTGVKPTLGYREHIVVDGGRARVILGVVILPGDIMDNTPLPDLLWRARFRWKLNPKYAVADARYGTIENIRVLEDAGIRAYFPLPDFEERTAFYGPSRFTYDATHDVYRCPQKQLLHWERDKPTEGVAVYRADAATCNDCPFKAECTDSANGRIVHRSLFAEYVEQVKRYHETESYRRAMRKRQVWVEPLFGESKQWHNFRRMRLRGIEKVNIEGQLVAAGQNLKRWLKATGWGRRTVPGEAALAVFAPPAHPQLAVTTTVRDYLPVTIRRLFSTGWAVL